MSERVLICGSRDWKDWEAVEARVRELAPGTLVIEGGASGVDGMAHTAATDAGFFVARIDCSQAHWERYKKRAGFLRNCAMLDLEPDLVIAFSTGSRGTQLTIDEARRRRIPVEIHGTERIKDAHS